MITNTSEFSAVSGDMKYYPKKMKCQCCHKTKGRMKFRKVIISEDGEKNVCLSVCRTCRQKGSTEHGYDSSRNANLKWDARQNISAPLTIKLLEDQAKQ